MTRETTIGLNGLAFHCKIDEPTGGGADLPWLVFSNSLMTDLSLWEDQVAALGDRYRILRYDQRGHGKTTVPAADCNFDDLADDMAELFDALGIARAAVVGVSMGGITALRFAGRHPVRVSALLISDCTAKSVPGAGSAWDERIAIAEKGGMAALAGPTVERWFRPASVESNVPSVERVRRMVSDTPFLGFVRGAAALRDFDFMADLQGLRCPTALLVGAGDGGLPGVMKQMAEQAPGSTFIEIADAGHLPNIENPANFNRELNAFLGRVLG